MSSTDRNTRIVETARKLAVALEWLEHASGIRKGSGCYGRMVVELQWEDGQIKRLRLVDETSVEDLSAEALAILLRSNEKKSVTPIDTPALLR